ncbi:SKP1-like protein 1 [Diospyros lotus]|uniref:SKP1-like protein 1 n=1 Tax=Diospyros lotus TaxID=55363 RepID=UPI00224E4F16|nr:SKP1-like protein 1 [Diospyros lotus]
MSEEQKKKKKKLSLKSSDGRKFLIDEWAAVQSEMLRLMIEDGCASDVIPLPNVDSRTLAMVIHYCERHGDPLVKQADLKAFDNRFVQKDQATLFDLLIAANYLQIPALLDKVAQKIANMIEDMSPEQVRRFFNIKNDFTLEEEGEEIRRQNDWAFK